MSWLLLAADRPRLYLGLLAAATFGPVLLLGAFAGALVDRMRPAPAADRHPEPVDRPRRRSWPCSPAPARSRSGCCSSAALAGGCILAVDGPARQVYVLELVGTRAHGQRRRAVRDRASTSPACSARRPAASSWRRSARRPASPSTPPRSCRRSWCCCWPHRRRPDRGPRAARRVGAGRPRATSGGRRRSGPASSWPPPAGMLFNFGVALPLLVTHTFHARRRGLRRARGGLRRRRHRRGAVRRRRPDRRRAAGGCALLAAATGATVLATAAAPELGAGVRRPGRWRASSRSGSSPWPTPSSRSAPSRPCAAGSWASGRWPSPG